jgi:hypothetical protein
MTKLVFAAMIAMSTTAALAQHPKAQRLQACKQLALERGFKFGAFNKGAIKPKNFIRGCMQGTQK